jgi:YVTN family beta-propeller protein
MERAFRILGPLEVELDGSVLALGGRRERAILGILLLNSGEVVSVERLIDGVWGEARPASAKHMVHEYVSRLRYALGEDSPIATRPPGYLLETDALDARQLAEFVAEARAAAARDDHAVALRAYDRALALWRGDVLADLQLEGQAHISSARLDAERRLVGEERIECALALGRHVQLIPELERRVEEAPLHERSRAQLMLALYRAGRQTDALERCREGRSLLVERAGVEPGRELRELERAILRHDPALELEPAMRVEDRSSDLVEAPEPGHAARRLWTRGLAGIGLAAMLGTLLLVFGRSGSDDAIGRIDANSAGAIDPARNRLVAQVATGPGPGRIAAGFDSLWVVNAFNDTVSRIDPATGATVETIEVDGDPTAIAVGAGFVWVACTGTRSLNKIDPRLNRVVQRPPVGNGPSGIAISPGAVWSANRLDDTVTEIDSKTGAVRRTLAAGPSPSDIVYGLGALWVANRPSSTVTRIDPRTGGLQAFATGNGPEAIAIGDGSIWTANSLDGTVSRIDPRRNAVTAAVSVGAGPSSLLFSEGAIWAAVGYGRRIVRIDPASNRIVSTIGVGSAPQHLAALGGRIWLSTRQTTVMHRGGTLRAFRLAPDFLDSAVAYAPTAWSVLSVTGDGLVGFKRVGGLDGGTLVPDLATSLPTPTAGGRTYTFQLRRGVRYANGDPVRASDLRRALERVFRLGSSGIPLYSGIVGADACSKARCDLAHGIVTDDRASTVSVHLRKPDTEFLHKLALTFAFLVPRRVPMTRPARLGVPGTGPYMIRSHAHSRLVLVRNPRFREWSPAARPDGYPDRIVLSLDNDLDERRTGAHVTAVERGSSDIVASPLPASRQNEIATRYASQLHVFPASKTFALFLNTSVPPFDNLKARQAFNLAIDRSTAVAAFGGVRAAAPTCQIVPAGMAGYQPYCPYTRNPDKSGLWAGTDLARARTLVTASGTQGQKVTIWTGSLPPMRLVGRLAVATLNRIGYRASLRVVDYTRYFETVSDSRTRAQAGFDAWAQDYPAASNFLMLFTCRTFRPDDERNSNRAEMCDDQYEEAFDGAASRPTGSAPGRWSAVDRLATDIAPWVPLVNAREVAFVSRRVGNLQANPQWGVLMDQLWVR